MKLPATVSTSHLNHTPPTARELLRVGYEEEQNGKLAQLNRLVAGSILAARVEKVLALHSIGDVGLPPSARPRCGSCREHWPCPTVRILNGEE